MDPRNVGAACRHLPTAPVNTRGGAITLATRCRCIPVASAPSVGTSHGFLSIRCCTGTVRVCAFRRYTLTLFNFAFRRCTLTLFNFACWLCRCSTRHTCLTPHRSRTRPHTPIPPPKKEARTHQTSRPRQHWHGSWMCLGMGAALWCWMVVGKRGGVRGCTSWVRVCEWGLCVWGGAGWGWVGMESKTKPL
jgi:hypothetical protein